MRSHLAFVALLGACAPAPPPAGEGSGVLRVAIQGELDRGTQAQLHRAIERAAASGDALIVELDTPGGAVDLMKQMTDELVGSTERGVRTIGWVNAQAMSAGSLIAMACERLYMRPHATLGSAYPVTFGWNGVEPVSEDANVNEKFVSDVRAVFRAAAEARKRPGVLAEAMVDPKVEVVRLRVDGEVRLASIADYDDLRARGIQPEFLATVDSATTLLAVTGSQAVDLGIADGLADTIDEVVLKLGQGPRVPVTIETSRAEDLVRLLFTLTPVLLIAGFALMYIEIKTPGFGVAGTLSIACFLAVFFARWLVGIADVLHLVLLLVGAGLVAVELLLAPGTVWPGILGVCCVIAGLLLSVGGGFGTAIERGILVDQLRTLVLSGFVALLLIWGLSRVLPRTPVLSRMVLAPSGSATGAALRDAQGHAADLARAGARGRALTALRPVGKVVLDADPALEFEARASGPEIASGASVRVVEVEAGRLLVERDPGDGAPRA